MTEQKTVTMYSFVFTPREATAFQRMAILATWSYNRARLARFNEPISVLQQIETFEDIAEQMVIQSSFHESYNEHLRQCLEEDLPVVELDVPDHVYEFMVKVANSDMMDPEVGDPESIMSAMGVKNLSIYREDLKGICEALSAAEEEDTPIEELEAALGEGEEVSFKEEDRELLDMATMPKPDDVQ